MQIVITVPDALAPRVLAALRARLGYQPTVPSPAQEAAAARGLVVRGPRTMPNPESLEAFIARRFREQVAAHVQAHEGEQARLAAQAKAANEVTLS